MTKNSLMNLKETYAQYLSPYILWIVFIFLGKFYYLSGTTNGNFPKASVYLVLIRDIVTWSFLGFCLLKLKIIDRKKETWWVFQLFLFGLAVSLMRLNMSEMSFSDWLQHSLRNTLLPILFISVGFELAKNSILKNPSQILVPVMFCNVIFSIYQLLWQRELLFYPARPTGLMGDPIINSLFISLGWLVWRPKNYLLYFISTFFVFMVLGYASSVSVLVSIVLAILLISYRYLKLTGINKKLLLIVGSSAVPVVLGLCSPNISMLNFRIEGDNELLINKSEKILESLSETKNLNLNPDSSRRSVGKRIQHNLLPFEVCNSDNYFCLVGDISKEKIWKVDANWASLVLNWGLPFFFISCGLLFFFMYRLVQFLNENGIAVFLKNMGWLTVFISILGLFFFNTVTYKFPINILLYLSVGVLFYEVISAAKKTRSDN